ncbi:hypothetical protein QDD76_004978 [Burkholderia cepacia]|jgi:hypothetical protein|uniref:Conjugal transfer protein n=1 Tax=Burkholderia contaminans TaxID=488447 RepID=A0ABD7YG54_9BURK|nr:MULTISPECIES: hypothetical protein [Burkholderia]EKS9798985.1 hypothetical protein [Burkholderia cepacia]EKS9805939.1 hypothetical protein [Burkholderia cepacia]EKS9813487.1 hypothetical protein [Burkholderia cepacia]EKS9820326.1 hypothetical protein [Burkholderia cepacia]EKS9828191.1 hypothetical protein [Burkholderia cepacia]
MKANVNFFGNGSSNRRTQRLLVLALMMTAGVAQAGGLDAGKSGLSTFQVWLYSCTGILAACYLLYVGIQCFQHKQDWVHDFGTAFIKVFVTGAGVVLAGYLFALGAN